GRETNTADGNDRTDVEVNVERLAFADRVISLDGTDDAPASGADTAQTGLNTPLTLPASDALMARPEAPETTENVGLTLAPQVLLANDADANGHPSHIERVDAAGRGSVVLNPDGAITYTPAANFHGTDAFSYTVRNSEGATRRATALMRARATIAAPRAGAAAAQRAD